MTIKKSTVSAVISAILAVCMLISSAMISGCSKEKKIKIPADLSREEAALYLALANVCPIGDNNTKAEFLTFRFEGWSFTETPEAINKYIEDYSNSGSATLVQADDATLQILGLIKKGDGDFYGTDENVYAEGKGKIFTFILGEDQNIDSDNLKVSVKSYKSDKDTSGFDVNLKFVSGNWEFVDYSGAWNQYQFFTPEPTNQNGSKK